MFFRRKKARDTAADSAEAQKASGAGEEVSGAGQDSPVDRTTQFLTGDSQTDRRTIQVLLEAIARVSESQDDIATQLRVIVDHSIEITGAERGLLLVEGDGEILEVRVARSKEGEDLPVDQRFSTSIVKKVAGELDPVRATVNSDAEALDLGQSVFDLKLRAVMCVPLTMHKKEGGEEESDRSLVRRLTRRDATVQSPGLARLRGTCASDLGNPRERSALSRLDRESAASPGDRAGQRDSAEHDAEGAGWSDEL